MDKNQVIGFILIGVILVGYVMLTKPSAEELKHQQRLRDSLAKIEQVQKQKKQNAVVADSLHQNVVDTTTQQNLNSDSANVVNLQNQFGVFSKAAQGKEKFILAQNKKMKIKFTTKGGRIYSVQLLGYLTHDKKPLILFDGSKNRFNLNFFAGNKLIKTEDLYFEPVGNDTIFNASDKEQIIRLRAKISDSQYLEYQYTIKPDKYLVDFNIDFVNLGKIIPINTTFIELYWDEYVRHLERGEKWERENTELFYKLFESDVKNLSPRKQTNEEDVSSKIRWISYKQQFFNSTLIAKNYFEYAKLKYKTLPNDTVNLYLMQSKITVPFKPGNDVKIDLVYFFGPNKYSLLRKIKINGKKMQLEKLIPLGKNIIAWTNKILILPLFNFLGKFIHNYGIIILIMTILIKLVLFPFTYKSYASSAKMRIIKPELDKVLAKIPEKDQVKRQQATMDLYKKAGISPLGGCLPMLLQFPILVALFRFFPASIELRQQSFLWVKDLSTYDAILTWHGNIPIISWIFGNHISLFTLLMAVTMIFNTLLNSQNMSSTNPQAKSMKWMMYLFPLLMIVWFNNYSAGLSYYYFLASLIGILQIYTIRWLMDEDKILAEMRENMKNPKTQKKSNFQKRLEEMQKQQAQMNKYKKKK
jgi:YidC/Oxa1 family membrane protein insertase